MTVRSRRSPLLLVAVLAMGAALAGCPKKPVKKPDLTPTPSATATPAPTPTPDLDAQMRGQTGPDATSGDMTACGAQPIHFDLDSSTLKPETTVTLKAIAACLAEHKTWTVRCEGHADERGSTQYNLALGDRRARAVSKYLVDGGIEKARVDTISYGSEKPANPAHEDVAWAQNRRVEFRITQK